MKVYVAASLLAMLIGSSAQTAFATNSHDPNLDHYYHGNLHVQVLDESPIVTVVRKPPQAPNWIIDPTLPADHAPPTYRIQAGAPGGAPVGVAGGTVVVGPNSLPFAGPTSNMRSLQAPPAHLQNGGIANHVQISQGVQAELMNKGHNQAQSANAGPLATHAPTVPLKYAPDPASGAGKSLLVTTTSTNLTLRERGRLLKMR